MNSVIGVVLTGVGATAFTDAWTIIRGRLLGVTAPNYALVGRWLAHTLRGRFRHDSILRAPAARAERLIGWVAHYLIGIGFAAIVPAIWGLAWLQAPTLAPALLVGLLTVAAPFFVMQPAFGLGVAASRTPRPGAARLHSVITHAIFGLGLYLAGRVASFVCAL